MKAATGPGTAAGVEATLRLKKSGAEGAARATAVSALLIPAFCSTWLWMGVRGGGR
jgi:hypothetical protein